MKIVHPSMETQIDFEDQSCICLVIENSKEFYKLTSEFYKQNIGEEGNFILSDESIIDISKACIFVYDYYSDLLNNRKSNNILSEKAITVLKNNDFIEEFSNLNALILEINEKIAEQMDLNVNYIENIDYETFVKQSKFRVQMVDNILENILSYIEVNQHSNTKIIVFVNLFSVLNERDINILLKQISYMQYKTLLIETSLKYKITGIKTIIIDDDLCEI